jgi:hypothetical protein
MVLEQVKEMWTEMPKTGKGDTKRSFRNLVIFLNK